MNRHERARRFRDAHAGESPLILPNAWDVMTARTFEDAGFEAIATTSFGIDRAHGLVDGENASLDVTLAMVRRMTAALSVPLTVDFESGFSDVPDDVARHALALIDAGAVGLNLEDAAAPPELHCRKIRAIRRAAGERETEIFINARIDVYWRSLGAPAARLGEAIRRAAEYEAAGADGVFIPGLTNRDEIRTAIGSLRVPLNLLANESLPPIAELAALGVRRLSIGSGAARATIATLRRVADELRTTGTYGFLADAPSYAHVNRP